MASDIAEMATVPEPVPRSPNIEPNNNLHTPWMHQDADSEESKRCRICFEPSSEVEGEQSGELISPCACKGTQQYVHKSCLARWQEVTLKQPNNRRAVICSVCTTPFSTRLQPEEGKSPARRGPYAQLWINAAHVPPWSRRFLLMLLLGVTGLLHNFRHIPAVFHVAAVLIAMVCAISLTSSVGIADGDPVPGIQPGRFLIADRIPRGSIFHKSVVLILEHGRHGTLGVIVNNANNIGGPVPDSASTFLTDFSSGVTRPVAGIQGLHWGRGMPPLLPQDAGGGGMSGAGEGGGSGGNNMPPTSPGVLQMSARSHPGEEGGGFPFYDTLRQQVEGESGRLKVLRGVCGWAPRQLDGEVRRGGWKLVQADAHVALVAIQQRGRTHTERAASSGGTVDADTVWRYLYDSGWAFQEGVGGGHDSGWATHTQEGPEENLSHSF